MDRCYCKAMRQSKFAIILAKVKMTYDIRCIASNMRAYSHGPS